MRLRTKLIIGYAVVFVLMMVNAGVTYTSVSWLISSRDAVALTDQTVILASRVEGFTAEMQNSKRGFVLNPDDEIFRHFGEARHSYEQVMERLETLVSTNPTQLRRLNELESRVNTWIDTVALPQMEARKTLAKEGAPPEKLATLLKEGTSGRTLIRDVHTRLAAFSDAQRVLREQQSRENEFFAKCSVWIVLVGTALALVCGAAIIFVTTRSVVRQVGGEPAAIEQIADEIGKGNLDVHFEGDLGGGTGIKAAIGTMLGFLRKARSEAQDRDWLRTGIARLNEAMSGDPEVADLAAKAITEISSYLNAQVGVLYVAEDGAKPRYRLMGSYAYKKRKNLSNVFELGEGLVGQAARENQQILVSNVPEDYITVTSGTGETVPAFICVTPFAYEGRVKGVLEIATLTDLKDLHLTYLEQVMPILAVVVEASERRTKLATALAQSQQLSEELQVQQEELRTTNEELQEHTQRLKQSEEKLRIQQEELQVTNAELEEKNELLQRQKREVERANQDIEVKAKELAVASKYKSEFLSNMSHELRTPLNSLLLLAQTLAENKEGTLTEEQVQSARIIQRSGADLLNLINEILDLAKIEAGRMDLRVAPFKALSLAEGIRGMFQPLAEQKGLGLEVAVSPEAPPEIVTDRKRMEQVVKNLVSNAIKFTHTGSVAVTYCRPAAGVDLSRSGLRAEESIAVVVKDTGIGVPEAQQNVIFEAFQQGDGSTARKYGGTGLGLSISRELARLLGGEIQLESRPGSGSTFTLYLPILLKSEGTAEYAGTPQARNAVNFDAGNARQEGQQHLIGQRMSDDREGIAQGDKAILVVEDDPRFAKILCDKCHEKGFKCLAAGTGEEGLAMAAKYLPLGIILDIRLPGIDGWAVLTALKEDTRTRHIPVHVASVEEASVESIRKGAIGHVTKPLSREDLEEAFKKLEETAESTTKKVLIVEDDPEMRHRITELISDGDVEVDEAATGREALEAMHARPYACVILDIGLPDMEGTDLLKQLEREKLELPPIIIHTARDLSQEQQLALREYADSVVLKDVRSTERLLDEVSLFLHRMVSRMPETKRQIIKNLYETDSLLKDKKVLIVDDDMRTLFALSRLLTERGMKTLKAENGEGALRVLDSDPDVDVVLMDIMMPVMDGYETMTRIREQEKFRGLPIIALTAKAMPKDREHCLAAGANDYMTKPLDPDRLISMLRVWLYR